MFDVLLPIDADKERSRAAVEGALSLPAVTDQVQVTILNIQEEVEISGSEGGRVSSDQWYDEDEFPESAIEAKQRLEEVGVALNLRREHADPAEAIIEVANEIGADRIIMAGRKRSPVGKVLFGSVTQSVLLDADVPTTVVPAIKPE